MMIVHEVGLHNNYK